MEEFFRRDDDQYLLDKIQRNTKRYVSIFSELAEKLMPERTKEKTTEERWENMDVLLHEQRLNNYMDGSNNPQNQLPPQLKRNFEVFITAGSNYKKKVTQLRELKSDKIGTLVMVKAIVVRTSEVKPLL